MNIPQLTSRFLVATSLCTMPFLVVARVAKAGDVDYYAAIARSSNTGKYGFSYGRTSRYEAEQEALEYCDAPDAKVVVWTRNAWCVLALGDDVGDYGWAWATSLSCAKSRALAECRKRTTNCYVAVSVFSGN